MKRDLYYQLVAWKKNPNRKPLLLRGARQVGKTYLLQHFGATEYDNVIYLDFDENPDLDKFFTKNLDPKRILSDLAIYFGTPILPDSTLIILDEIQESHRALTSLKYFCEKTPNYHVVAAGSLLGVKIANNKGFPVGKVTFLDLYPASFFEFLSAIGKIQMRNALEEKTDLLALADPLHNEFTALLKTYYIVGGMPEVIATYLRNSTDLTTIRKIQQDILNAYELDFSKHTDPYETVKILKIWNSIPTQLSKENKKFKYSLADKHARSREYSNALEWLEHAGLILTSSRISTPKLPLEAYSKENSLKIFLLDVGLLGAMSRLPPQIILEGDRLFSEFKGAFTENFVAQEIIQTNNKLYYWSIVQQAEIDFIIQHNSLVLPLEVKAERGKKTKSLQHYATKFSPEYLIRTSLRNFKKDGNFFNIPLYSISQLLRFLRTSNR